MKEILKTNTQTQLEVVRSAKKKFEFQFKKQGFNFKKCVNCSHIYVDPQINEQALSKAYTGGDKSASDVWMDVLLSSDNQEYDLKKYNVGLDLISKYLSDKSPNPNILDIGCSIGLFLNEAKKGTGTVLV